ncbi:MAG: cysteine--tRNA ligase [Flavobacteriales bacterium]|nr:cysteine--tRNA ligase [Flavobacteriales bacterium]|tara:strand:- start:1632 stop:3107 length:1476 start_codon:yes stop_codon:yes gene_type:complete
MSKLKVYNTITKEKQLFEPINYPNVGMYVCGPTVYSDVHIGNCRTIVSFDVIYRYLKYLGYSVRYVRNITDVGHLENDGDEGEDKIAKKAKLEKIEPMEVVQRYTNGFHDVVEMLNTLKPSIEPTATGHMIEQIEYVQEIIDSGYAYESNGSVYFDVEKYSEKYNYGEISGRKIEDLRSNTRDLKGQSEKKCPLDFVIWKKAEPKHTMQWNSPWGKGFPGWHLECSVMSTKYLGEEFDIHGGGMDLKFPHHECELAQNTACSGRTDSVKYWLHSNMLTLNGEKMSKSTGQFFLPEQIFKGTTELLEKPYSPMVVRFAMMQCHYRSTMDLSNDALSAAEKGLTRLKNGIEAIDNLIEGEKSYFDIESIENSFKLAINDDFNTPVLVANLFDVIKQINLAIKGNKLITKQDREALKGLFEDYLTEIMGVQLNSKTTSSSDSQTIEDDLIQLAVKVRNQAKNNKDWETSDLIRNKLSKLGVQLKDSKDGTQWSK